MKPADATGTLTVINTTKYSAKVTITYHSALCRDDHPTVAPHAQWSVNSGLCKVSNSFASLRDSKGTDQRCQGKSGNTSQHIWRILINYDPSERKKPAADASKLEKSLIRRANMTNYGDPLCNIAES